MLIPGLFDNGSMPVLERVVQFTDARNSTLADGIANMSTPNYQPRDTDPKEFQSALGKAIQRRRDTAGGAVGELKMDDTSDIKFTDDGVKISPKPSNDSIMFHDKNNRDLERMMQRLAENTLTHNAAIEMLRNQFSLMQAAIRERV